MPGHHRPPSERLSITAPLPTLNRRLFLHPGSVLAARRMSSTSTGPVDRLRCTARAPLSNGWVHLDGRTTRRGVPSQRSPSRQPAGPLTNGAAAPSARGYGRLSLTAREGRAAPGLPQRPVRRPERAPQSRAERSDVAERGAAPLTVGDGAATRAGSARAQRAERQAERSEGHWDAARSVAERLAATGGSDRAPSALHSLSGAIHRQAVTSPDHLSRIRLSRYRTVETRGPSHPLMQESNSAQVPGRESGWHVHAI